MRRVSPHYSVRHTAGDLFPVGKQHTIMENGHIRGLYKLLPLELRRLERDIVALPLTRLPRRVDERRPLSVDRACLTIGVGWIIPGIEHLNLITIHQQHPAIPSPLAGAIDF